MKSKNFVMILKGMDEPWEASIVEYGAVNVTGYRIVDPARKYVRDFLTKWAALDKKQFPGAGQHSISVREIYLRMIAYHKPKANQISNLPI